MGRVLFEIVLKQRGQMPGAGLEICGVLPGASWSQQFGGHAGTTFGNQYAEDRVWCIRHGYDCAAQRSTDHGPRVAELDPAALPIRPTGPAGVQEPDL